MTTPNQTRNIFLAQCSELENAGTKILGFNVMWTIREDIRTSPATVSQFFASAGAQHLSKYVPSLRDISGAWYKAADLWKSGRGIQGIECRAIGRANKGIIKHGFIRAVAERDADRFQLTNEECVILDVGKRQWTSKTQRAAGQTGNVTPIHARWGSLFSEAQGALYSDDIRAMFKRIIVDECNGFALKSSGGCYFVMARHKGTIDALRNIAEMVSTNPDRRTEVTAFPIPDAEFVRESIHASCKESLVSKLNAFKSQTAAWLKRGTKKREKSFDASIKRVQELTKEARAFESMLGFKMDEVHELHRALTDELRALRADPSATIDIKASPESTTQDDKRTIESELDALLADLEGKEDDEAEAEEPIEQTETIPGNDATNDGDEHGDSDPVVDALEKSGDDIGADIDAMLREMDRSTE